MNNTCLSFLILFLISLLLDPARGLALPNQVPIVSAAFFEPGRHWTWEYREGDQFYSSERYTVLERAGDQILIEMSTRLKPDETFRAHHRLQLSIKKCIDAYTNPVSRKPWSLTMFHLDAEGKWQAFDPGTTLAFEEKFNCNPHVYRSYGASYKTIFVDSAAGALFEHKRWGRLDGSRFFLNGINAGVAAEKHFAKPKGESYVFRFVHPEPSWIAAAGV